MDRENPMRGLRGWLVLLGILLALPTFWGGLVLWSRITWPVPDRIIAFLDVAAPADVGTGGRAGDRYEARYAAYAPGVPLYLVENGRLYLRQETVLGVERSLGPLAWTASMLAELVRQHPELKPLLPAPEAGDGGVRWLAR